MNKLLYNLIIIFIFLILNIYSLFFSATYYFKYIKLIFSVLFVIGYFSYLIIFQKQIIYSIKNINNNNKYILYWISYLIYCISYLLFFIIQILNKKYIKIGLYSSILFLISSILFMYSTFNKKYILQFISNDKNLLFYGGVAFTFTSIFLIIAFLKNNKKYFIYATLLLIIGRSIFLIDSYMKYKDSHKADFLIKE